MWDVSTWAGCIGLGFAVYITLCLFSLGGSMRWIYSLLLVLLAAPSLSLAQLRDENLLQNLPKGYKLDFQNRRDDVGMSVMLPQGETEKNWTEVVITKIFFGLKAAEPKGYQEFSTKKLASTCKNGAVTTITTGKENGYPFSVWQETCPLNPATGKPEAAWFKAIKGNDSFYVIEKTFRFVPSNELVQQWMEHLRTVTVCDTRSAEHPCPKLEPIGPVSVGQ